MKRILSIVLIVFVLLGSMGDKNVFAADYTVKRDVTSQGLFIGHTELDVFCGKNLLVDEYSESDEEVTGYNFNQIISGLLVNFSSGLINFFIKQVENLDNCGGGGDPEYEGSAEGESGSDSDEEESEEKDTTGDNKGSKKKDNSEELDRISEQLKRCEEQSSTGALIGMGIDEKSEEEEQALIDWMNDGGGETKEKINEEEEGRYVEGAKDTRTGGGTGQTKLCADIDKLIEEQRDLLNEENRDELGKNLDEIYEKHDKNIGSGKMKFGMINQLNVFSVIVNITNVDILMYLTGVMQYFALILMILLLLYQVTNILRGKRHISEDTVVPMVIRFGIAMAVVYYAPRLLQDILSLNNLLVHIIGESVVVMETNTFTGDTRNQAIPIRYAAIATFTMFLMLLAKAVFGVAMTGWYLVHIKVAMAVTIVIIIISMMLAVLIPLIKIVIWWYTRLFKLFVFTIISPLFLMMFATQETSGHATGFLKNYIKTVFEQFFVMIAFAMLLTFFVELPNISEGMSLGFVGVGIGLYAGLNFISQVPSFVQNLLDGDVKLETKGMNKSVNKVANKARRAGTAKVKRGVSKVRGRFRR